MRIDSPIYFANVIPVREAIAKYQRRALRALVPRGIALRYIIIDMSPVTDIDASAVHWLKVCCLLHFCEIVALPTPLPWLKGGQLIVFARDHFIRWPI